MSSTIQNIKKLNIALFSVEIAPYAKDGRLGEIVGILLSNLRKNGIHADAFMPFYGSTKIPLDHLTNLHLSFPVEMGIETHEARVYRYNDQEGNSTYLIANHYLFGSRKELYGKRGDEFPDNAKRFIFFCKAALLAIQHLQLTYDIIHCHDWHTAIVPFLLKVKTYTFPPPKTILTIHDLHYQGIFTADNFNYLNVAHSFFNASHLEYYGNMNILKAGIIFADKLTTLSPTYAGEIQSPEFGLGLEKLIRLYSSKLVGILNGVDYSEWDPKISPFIPHNYSPASMQGKKVCKADLQQNCKLPVDATIPLITIISHSDWFEDFSFIPELFTELLKHRVQIVMMGAQGWNFHRLFNNLVSKYKSQIGFINDYSDQSAHAVIAGADIFLSPLQLDPGSLNQLYCLRFGTIPIGKDVAGFADTVIDVRKDVQQGTGFILKGTSPQQILETVLDSIKFFADKEKWSQIVINAMKQDFSWTKVVPEYISMYYEILK